MDGTAAIQVIEKCAALVKKKPAEADNVLASGDNDMTDISVQICSDDGSSSSLDNLSPAEDDQPAGAAIEAKDGADESVVDVSNNITIAITPPTDGQKKGRQGSFTDGGSGSNLGFLSRSTRASGSLGEVFSCPSCHSWNLSQENSICTVCSCPSMSKPKVLNDGSFGPGLKTESGRHTKIFRAPDIPFSLPTLSRSPREILEKKAAMLRERSGSREEAELIMDLVNPQQLDIDDYPQQQQQQPTRQNRAAPFSRKSPYSRLPPPCPSFYSLSSSSPRETFQAPPPVLPAAAKHGSGSGCSILPKSLYAEKSPMLLAIKDELHKKMNLLNQLDYLKASLYEDNIERDLKEKASIFLMIKDLEQQLADINTGRLEPKRTEPSVPELLNKNEELRKELYYCQKELRFIRSELDFIKQGKVNQQFANREENILYKLLPHLEASPSESRSRNEGDPSKTPNFLNKRKKEQQQLPATSPPGRGVAFTKIFSGPEEKALSGTAGVCLPHPLPLVPTLPKVDPLALGLSQGPCMKFNNLYDLSGQFVDFCKGENGSKFVVERLTKGTVAERLYARSELKLATNFSELIGQEHGRKVLMVLLEVDKESRQEVMKYIRTHVANNLVRETFLRFVCDYLERVNPVMKEEVAQAISEELVIVEPEAATIKNSETTGAKINLEEARKELLSLLQEVTSDQTGKETEKTETSPVEKLELSIARGQKIQTTVQLPDVSGVEEDPMKQERKAREAEKEKKGQSKSKEVNGAEQENGSEEQVVKVSSAMTKDQNEHEKVNDALKNHSQKEEQKVRASDKEEKTSVAEQDEVNGSNAEEAHSHRKQQGKSAAEEIVYQDEQMREMSSAENENCEQEEMETDFCIAEKGPQHHRRQVEAITDEKATVTHVEEELVASAPGRVGKKESSSSLVPKELETLLGHGLSEDDSQRPVSLRPERGQTLEHPQDNNSKLLNLLEAIFCSKSK